MSENVVNRIFTGRFGTLHESVAKTDFFDFVRLYAVLTYVVNSILRPNELVDRHPPILKERMATGNASAERPGVNPR